MTIAEFLPERINSYNEEFLRKNGWLIFNINSYSIQETRALRPDLFYPVGLVKKPDYETVKGNPCKVAINYIDPILERSSNKSLRIQKQLVTNLKRSYSEIDSRYSGYKFIIGNANMYTQILSNFNFLNTEINGSNVFQIRTTNFAFELINGYDKRSGKKTNKFFVTLSNYSKIIVSARKEDEKANDLFVAPLILLSE